MPEQSPKTGPDRVFADTNLFLRYLTNDVPEQAEAVQQLLLKAGSGEVVLVINPLVVAEIVWVLESFYRLPRIGIRDRVLAILNTPGIEAAQAETILQALLLYGQHNVDFIDAFNGAWLVDEGLTRLYTFDRAHFARLPDLAVEIPGKNLVSRA